MKGSDVNEEVHEARASLLQLHADIKKIHAITLPVEQASRHLIVIHKRGTTPKKFPRKAGIPAKSALI